MKEPKVYKVEEKRHKNVVDTENKRHEKFHDVAMEKAFERGLEIAERREHARKGGNCPGACPRREHELEDDGISIK